MTDIIQEHEAFNSNINNYIQQYGERSIIIGTVPAIGGEFVPRFDINGCIMLLWLFGLHANDTTCRKYEAALVYTEWGMYISYDVLRETAGSIREYIQDGLLDFLNDSFGWDDDQKSATELLRQFIDNIFQIGASDNERILLLFSWPLSEESTIDKIKDTFRADWRALFKKTLA